MYVKNIITLESNGVQEKDCTNKAEYKKKMDEKGANPTTENKYSKDFKWLSKQSVVTVITKF